MTETTGRAISHRRALSHLDFLEITEINEMPETFVLIRGAWHTGEDFEPIANILRDAGHTVYCPTLRGNRPEDDRSKLGLADIRLVGHSYAGMVISGVANRLEKRPRRLVYINAFVPLKGTESERYGYARLCCGLRRNRRGEQRRSTAPIRDMAGELYQRRRYRTRTIHL